MEFPFDVGKVLPGRITILEIGINDSDIKIYDSDSKESGKQDNSTSWIYHLSANAPWDIKLKKKKEELTIIVDELGHASALAQNLRSPITTLKKLLNSSQQKIYIVRGENNKSVIGFLKIGVKRLFVCDDTGAHHELDPLCVLDFYVHETKQRCGFGHELFNFMLKNEKMVPDKLAIDRPSFKFLSFLGKHYDLKNPIAQSNNYVIYPTFFINREVTRPPIFLYNGKAMQPVKYDTPKKQYSDSGSYANKAEALNSIKVSLCTNELKKNRTFYSSAANCLTWNDGETHTNNRNGKYHNKSSSCSRINNSGNIQNMLNINLGTAVQSCSDAHKNVDRWSSRHSTPCSLTPVVDNSSGYSRKKWDQMQSSWNIFGVKPIDYSVYQKQN